MHSKSTHIHLTTLASKTFRIFPLKKTSTNTLTQTPQGKVPHFSPNDKMGVCGCGYFSYILFVMLFTVFLALFAGFTRSLSVFFVNSLSFTLLRFYMLICFHFVSIFVRRCYGCFCCCYKWNRHSSSIFAPPFRSLKRAFASSECQCSMWF